jgi:hypothetical protein
MLVKVRIVSLVVLEVAEERMHQDAEVALVVLEAF